MLKNSWAFWFSRRFRFFLFCASVCPLVCGMFCGRFLFQGVRSHLRAVERPKHGECRELLRNTGKSGATLQPKIPAGFQLFSMCQCSIQGPLFDYPKSNLNPTDW